MILSQIVTDIQNRSGDSTISEAKITGWVNNATRLIANRADWPFYLKTYDTDTTTANTAEISLQSDFRKMYSLRIGGTTEPDGDEYTFVGYMEKNVAINHLSDAINAYYINPTNSKYGLIPTPTTTGTKIWQKYYRNADTVSAVSATPDLPTRYHDSLSDFGLARYWEEEDELDKTNFFETKFENGIETMYNERLKSVGQLTRMRDVRELGVQDHPQGFNYLQR